MNYMLILIILIFFSANNYKQTHRKKRIKQFRKLSFNFQKHVFVKIVIVCLGLKLFGQKMFGPKCPHVKVFQMYVVTGQVLMVKSTCNT